MSLAESQAAVTEEICNDILRMQLQPVIMDNYRRFVVLTDAEDQRSDGSAASKLDQVRCCLIFMKDFRLNETLDYQHTWLEWHSFDSFDFQDDFYKEDSEQNPD